MHAGDDVPLRTVAVLAPSSMTGNAMGAGAMRGRDAPFLGDESATSQPASHASACQRRIAVSRMRCMAPLGMPTGWCAVASEGPRGQPPRNCRTGRCKTVHAVGQKHGCRAADWGHAVLLTHCADQAGLHDCSITSSGAHLRPPAGFAIPQCWAWLLRWGDGILRPVTMAARAACCQCVYPYVGCCISRYLTGIPACMAVQGAQQCL